MGTEARRTAAEKGKCVVCGFWFVPRQDGLLRRHRADAFGAGWWCEGSLQEPSEFGYVPRTELPDRRGLAEGHRFPSVGSVACPTCGAEPGVMCVTTTGRAANFPHNARHASACSPKEGTQR